ncbi:MAG: FkbM family methyltransferase [Gemmatimonadaceae bacterium]
MYSPAKLVSEFLHWSVRTLLTYSVNVWVARQDRLRLIQVGANDGIMADPVHEIVKQAKVTSVLAEPVPRTFMRLARTYEAYPQVTCRQVAVVPTDDVRTVPFFCFAPKPGLAWNDLYSAWASTERGHLEKFRPFVPDFDQLISTENVPAITLDRLFRDTGWPTLDLLQIDVEGLDVALVASIPFAQWAPRLIRFEHIHGDRRELDALLTRLHAIGYRTFSHGFDTLCVRESEMLNFRWLAWMRRAHPAWFVPPR